MVSLVTFAGVTKTYALMPPLIVLGLALLVLIKERRYRIGGAVLGMIALLGVLHVVLTLSWQRLFDFGQIPSTFSLLRFELGMTSFYLELISYLALYLIPVLVLVAMSIGARLRGVEIGRKGSDNEVSEAWGAYWTPVCATVVTCVQVCFAYFYQWPDSRFTFILMPYLLISLSALVSVISLPMLLMVPLSVYLISFTVAVQPESGFFEPRVSTLKISTRTGWPNMWRSRPVDRFKLKDQCNSSEFCEQVVAPPQQSHYRRSIFEAYVALIKRELRDSIPPASER